MTASWFGLIVVLAFVALVTLAAFLIRRTPEQQALEDREQMEALKHWPEYEEHA